MKIIYIILGSLLVVFMLGGCSLKYFDPQFYGYIYLVKNKAGYYIYDKDLFEEHRIKSMRARGDEEITLSNGYKTNTEVDYKQRGSILSKCHKYSYRDNFGNNHLIYISKNYRYTYYGILLQGDEGAGFWFEFQGELESLSQEHHYMTGTEDDK